MQTLQAQLSSLRVSTTNMLQSSGTAELSQVRAMGVEEDDSIDSEVSSPTRPEAPVQFFELLRPLQNSFSCASLMSEWVSDNDDNDNDSGGDVGTRLSESHGQQQQPVSQPERDHSRMLRICCSVDNLLLSIGSQVQQEKHDEAIARGAARELVRLFQFAIKQVAATTPLVLSSPSGSASGHTNRATTSVNDAGSNELQYMHEFIVEIADRMGKLDHFVRSTLLREIDSLGERIARSEQSVIDMAQANAQLQTEMNDMRDFHANSSGMLVLGYGTGGSDRELLAREATSPDRRLLKLMSPVAETPYRDERDSTKLDEMQHVRGQCDELTRLLEMAKQEIRLCHRERDAQNAAIAELSSATFRDQELVALRNQLQSEKRRVKNLEIENVALRETEVDQAMKLHSLLLNSSTHGPPALGVRKDGGKETDVVSPARSRLDTNRRGSVGVCTVNSGSLQSPLLVVRSVVELPQPSSPSHSLTRQASGIAGGSSSSSPKRREHLSAPSGGSDESAAPRARWFYAAIGLVSESPTRRKLQSAHETPVEASGSFADQKQFLASLVMSDKQLAAAQVQSKARRLGNIPTLSPQLPSNTPVAQVESGLRPRNAGTAPKKRSVTAAATDGNSDQDHQDMIAACSQLIAFFYQRFLLADEARALVPAAMSSSSFAFESHDSAHELSLASVVLQFFFERTPTRDGDALRDAARFVRCLHRVRTTSADARFFCDFLDGVRSREELCFYLWTLQVVEETTVGVPYETPVGTASVSSGASAAEAPHICVLKATFLTRTIYRVFHVSAAKRPSAASSSVATSTVAARTARPLSASGSSKKDLSSPSPRSSPRKKRKHPVADVSALPPTLSISDPTDAGGSSSDETQATISVLDQALACFRTAVALNSGAPLTLEAFNALLFQFAVTPAPGELQARLGPFFQPTGDEKKLPLSVYLALILETFAHQLVWRKKTSRNLFVSLAQRHEAEAIAQQLRAKELAEAATTKGKRASQSKPTNANAPATTSPKKTLKMKKKKKREARDASVASTSKYLTGLSRALLGQFLVHAGIVSDVIQVDVDQLFVYILESCHRSATDVTFDDVYDTLRKLNWLGNHELRVDPTAAVFSHQWQTVESDARATMMMRLRDVWSVHSRQSLVLCENDPNVFVRRRARQLADSISDRLATFPPGDSAASDRFWRSLESIRDFLAFAWRTAAKRAGEAQIDKAKDAVSDTRRRGMEASTVPQWFMTEFYFVNRAIEVVAADVPGYLLLSSASRLSPDADKRVVGVQIDWNLNSVEEKAQSDLSCFWDMTRLPLDDLFGDFRSSTAGVNERLNAVAGDEVVAMTRELELVLKRFCYFVAHLFALHTSASFNSEGLALLSWLKLARELRRLDKQLPDTAVACHLFFQVYKPASSESTDSRVLEKRDLEVRIAKSQFTELLVRTAFAKAKACQARKLQLLPPSMATSTLTTMNRPAEIVADFCQRVVVPTSFHPRDRRQEVDFVGKLSCPLVSRLLLEHRAFLRLVFFYYAKQDAEDESDDRPECDDATVDAQTTTTGDAPLSVFGLQLGKTKRNSMNFDEFQAFLTAFELLETDDRVDGPPGRHVGIESARLVFRSVMALENGDTTQMEFEEFAAAIAALAAFCNPSPFCLWYVKIDAFVRHLERLASRKQLRFD